MDMIVGRAQRSDIAIADLDLAWRGEIVISPIKWFGAIRFEQDIGHETCVASVAIGKRMDLCQPMMKSGRYLINRH